MRKYLQEMGTFRVMDVLERAKELEAEGRDIIHLEVGEPDFSAPPEVIRALNEAVRSGETKYTHSLGIPELREEIARFYSENYRITVEPENIVVTSGTSPAMLIAFGSLLNEGDEVIITDPAYSPYPNFVKFLGGNVKRVQIREENGYVPDPEEVKGAITKRTVAIVLNSPSNPTGALIPPEILREIAEFGIPIISDEIYHLLTYDGDAHSILEFTPEAFVINGFSKAYAMTGWRLGYLIFPPRYLRIIQKMQQHFFISANAFVQRAGITALKVTGSFIPEVREKYRRRRDVMLGEFKKAGFNVKYVPRGAFYFLVNVSHIFPDSVKGAFTLLEKAGVAVAPGVDFGPSAEGHIRFSYSTSEDKIVEGLRRIKNFLNGRSYD